MIEFIAEIAQETATKFSVDLWMAYVLIVVIIFLVIILLLWIFKQLLILVGWFGK